MSKQTVDPWSLIDWSAEEYDDYDDFGPYSSPDERRREEIEINRAATKKLELYKRLGEYDYDND